MGKHRGQPDPKERDVIQSPRERDKTPLDLSPERIENDVAIVDNGWNNTPRDKR